MKLASLGDSTQGGRDRGRVATSASIDFLANLLPMPFAVSRLGKRRGLVDAPKTQERLRLPCPSATSHRLVVRLRRNGRVQTQRKRIVPSREGGLRGGESVDCQLMLFDRLASRHFRLRTCVVGECLGQRFGKRPQRAPGKRSRHGNRHRRPCDLGLSFKLLRRSVLLGLLGLLERLLRKSGPLELLGVLERTLSRLLACDLGLRRL